jgi:hypothetical protein
MRTPRSRAALAFIASAALVSPALRGQDGPAEETFGVEAPAAKALKAPRQVPSRRAEAQLGRWLAPQVALSTVDHEALRQEDSRQALTAYTKVQRFSVGRDFTVSAQDGAWTELADGSRLWVADVVSPGALGLRLQLTDLALPAGAELVVYGDAPEAAGATAAEAEFFFGSSAAPPTVWTRTVPGERAHIEYLAPAGSDAGELPFRLGRLQHVYRDPVADFAKAAGPCHNDVSCFPEWGPLARAVAGIGFVGENGFFCTGQLLNSKKPDFTPYFLTANHCLSSAGDAPFVEIYWNYQTASCGGAAPSLTGVPRSVGATLVSTNPQSDYTLLLIEGALPSGLFWSGWTSKSPANGADAVAIHHPRGDFKRISFAEKGPLGQCSDFFPGRKLEHIDWTDAPTEPGSSGSGVFRADNGQLFGQLLGGPSACGNESFDCYGAFATTFTKVKKPLNGGTDDKLEQNDSCARARLVKKGNYPGRIVKILDEDWYRISVKPGQTVDITLGFSHANGDVDLQFFGACNGGALFSSDGTTDSEALSIQNVGNRPAFAYWRVFLANDTRNGYNMTVGIR